MLLERVRLGHSAETFLPRRNLDAPPRGFSPLRMPEMLADSRNNVYTCILVRRCDTRCRQEVFPLQDERVTNLVPLRARETVILAK